MQKLVSVNIVNWNGTLFLAECLESVRRQTYSNIEINIIDNHSIDGSAEWLKKEFPDLQVIFNQGNEGFSRAHNQAIRISCGEYILPLNFDIVLSPKFVEEMVKAMEFSPEIGVVSGCLYAPGKDMDKNIIDSTGITIKVMFPADRGKDQLDCGQYGNMEYVFGASGAAPLLRRRMLEDISLNGEYFDEDYYIYVEDVDLCWRAQLCGWKALYAPKAIAYHRRGATRENNARMKKEYIILGNRNRYWTIVKNAICRNLLRNILWILLFESWFYVGHVLGRNYFIFRTLPMVIKGLPRMLHKRKEVQKRRIASPQYMETFFFGDLKETVLKSFARRLGRKN